MSGKGMNDEEPAPLFLRTTDEMMEEYLRLEGRGMSRATIGAYRRRLENLGLIAPMGDFVYYKVKELWLMIIRH